MALKIRSRNMFDFYVLPGGGVKIVESFADGIKPSASINTSGSSSIPVSGNTPVSGNVNTSSSTSGAPAVDTGTSNANQGSLPLSAILFYFGFAVCTVWAIDIVYTDYKNYKSLKEDSPE